MPSGIFLVESEPMTSDSADEFNRWYDEIHIPEILTVDGFVSARRFTSADGTKFVAVYEIDTDIDTAKVSLQAAAAAGRLTKPVAVKLDPPPSQRYFALVSEFAV
ncbi:hypothetical protein [Williamsia sp.]|uniref:hypothetical protein n=1 Tax=Williamsia sp. TaxID=1872085 RepID=UPI002F95CF6E